MCVSVCLCVCNLNHARPPERIFAKFFGVGPLDPRTYIGYVRSPNFLPLGVKKFENPSVPVLMHRYQAGFPSVHLSLLSITTHLFWI